MTLLKLLKAGTTALVVVLLLASCGGETPETTAPAPTENSGPSGSGLLKVGDKLFNLPSPIETAMLIEEIGGHFSAEMLNPNTEATKYSTTEAQAMNLGVYGADLGYSLIYGQSQSAFKLLATCKNLSTELGISPGLYSSLMKRFEGNLENRDSLLAMVSELNRLSDEYLKENESEDVSALILYGGWVESLYFTTTLSAKMENAELRNRVGEQKNSLENLIGLMGQVNRDGRLDAAIADLQALKTTFDQVEYTYEFVAPETVAAKKLTIIKSKSQVTVSDATMAEITSKIEAIRNTIIGA